MKCYAWRFSTWMGDVTHTTQRKDTPMGQSYDASPDVAQFSTGAGLPQSET